MKILQVTCDLLRNNHNQQKPIEKDQKQSQNRNNKHYILGKSEGNTPFFEETEIIYNY